MIANALLVAVALASQVSAPNDRYTYPADGLWGPADLADSKASDPQTATPQNAGPADGNSRPRTQPAGSPPANPYSLAPSGGSATPLYPAAGSDTRAPANPAAGASSRSSVPNGRQYGNPLQPQNVGSLAAEEDIGLKPSDMMRAMLAAPRGSRLTGQPVTLAEVVRGASSRHEQTERVDAYWDLCSGVADYYLGLREQEELRRLRTLVTQVGPSWQEAESELGTRIGTSQRAAAASQLRLGSFLGRTDPNLLPLPVDVPHCGDYHARYDEVFTGRPSPEAEQLRDLMPLRYEELKDAAAAVTRSEEWVNTVATQQSSNSEGVGTLRSLELLALRRRAFVQIARDYNRRIARYAELAAPYQIDPQQLVAMLIKVDDHSDTANRNSSPAPPSNRQSQTTGSTPQQTFANEWTPSRRSGVYAPQNDDAVRPASAEETQSNFAEQSLLVTPKGK